MRDIEYIQTQASAWTSIREQFEPWSQTVNGPGSTLAATEAIRAGLPLLLKEFDIATMLDAPCGDLNWMGLIDLSEVEYLGWDVEETIIERNRVRYPMLNFECVNLLLPHKVPQADLIVCRDFLIHLPTVDGCAVLQAFRDSRSRYLLTTTTPQVDNLVGLPPEGHDERPGYWYRPVDMDAQPYAAILGESVGGIQESEHQWCKLYELNPNV